ncbi:MAG: hypothetical protein ACT4PT_02990, partial [Methanobacteriota archaeon]
LSNSNSGQIAYARLYDTAAAAAVSGSEVTVTGQTVTRVRSGALALGAADVTYAAQIKAGGNDAKLRGAWLIVFQIEGKTYDHILKTKNDVAGSCTWSFTLAHASSSGLSRMKSATIAIRGDAALQGQIVVASGAVTQTTGSAVAVPFGTSLQHVVTTVPSDGGTTTIDGDVNGVCGGVRTVQRVTYVLT